MTEERLFFHSPFNPANVHQEHNPSLLLQFFFTSLFALEHQIQNKKNLPYSFFLCDRMKLASALDELYEHLVLFTFAFPLLQKETKSLVKILESVKKEKKQLKQQEKISTLFALLEPFLLCCKDNENFLFFLLKNQHRRQEIQLFLSRITFPHSTLKKYIAERFKQRNFFSLLTELEELTK